MLIPHRATTTLFTPRCMRLSNNHEKQVRKTFVTFDQPLYVKARDIVSAKGADSDFRNVIVRLGGFHLLMSFLGSIGFYLSWQEVA